MAILLSISQDTHALERTSSTSGFNWGDDLSQTSISVSGGVNGTYDTAPPVKMRSTHISDIKTAIEMAASVCGNVPQNVLYPSQDTQTLSMMGYPSKPLPALHINILRRAIEALYLAKYPGGTPSASTYFSGSVNQGERIQKAHIQQMRRALDDLVVSCAGGPRTPLCWTETGFECDLYPNPGCPNARRCGTYSYSDGSTEADLAPCDATAMNPPVGWTECGGGVVCGNGTVESGEQCDDSNTANGDGCSSTCLNEASACWPDGTLCQASMDMPPVWYIDCSLCCNNPYSNGTSMTAEVRCNEGFAACGNGAIESGEQCDDTNTANGDGCSSTCQRESCWPDGHVWQNSQLPIINSRRILDDRCCSGAAVCSAGSVYCECAGGTAGQAWQRALGVVGYSTSSECVLEGQSAFATSQNSCDALGAVMGEWCDGSVQNCLVGPGTPTGSIAPAPYGPGLRLRETYPGQCDESGGSYPCECRYQKLVCG